jgi:predicted AAA+ superfamily ATPase
LDEKSAFEANKDYITRLVESDISRIDNEKKDQIKVRNLLMSLSRTVCRLPTLNTLANDMDFFNSDVVISRPTAAKYIELLKKLFILQDVPSFS